MVVFRGCFAVRQSCNQGSPRRLNAIFERKKRPEDESKQTHLFSGSRPSVQTRSLRLAVRTPGSHPGNRGSIPLGITKNKALIFTMGVLIYAPRNHQIKQAHRWVIFILRFLLFRVEWLINNLFGALSSLTDYFFIRLFFASERSGCGTGSH